MRPPDFPALSDTPAPTSGAAQRYRASRALAAYPRCAACLALIRDPADGGRAPAHAWVTIPQRFGRNVFFVGERRSFHPSCLAACRRRQRRRAVRIAGASIAAAVLLAVIVALAGGSPSLVLPFVGVGCYAAYLVATSLPVPTDRHRSARRGPPTAPAW